MGGLELHPVFVLVAAGSLVCVFARALVHKLSDLAWFTHTLNGYRVLPPEMASLASFALIAAEALVVGGLVIPQFRAMAATLGLVLLLVYATAIAANLLRGNTRIDCGCGGAGQGLSWFLVLRNALLVCLAIAAAATPLPAELGVLGWVSVAAGIASVMLLLAGAEQLIENWSWLEAADQTRHHHEEGHH